MNTQTSTTQTAAPAVMTSTAPRVAITGNTYPVRSALRDLGGIWNASRKAWMVPADLADAARALLPARSERADRTGSSRRSGYRRASSRSSFSRCNHEDYPCCGCGDNSYTPDYSDRYDY